MTSNIFQNVQLRSKTATWKFKGVRAEYFSSGRNHLALTPLNFQNGHLRSKTGDGPIEIQFGLQ